MLRTPKYLRKVFMASSPMRAVGTMRVISEWENIRSSRKAIDHIGMPPGVVVGDCICRGLLTTRL